MNEQLYIPKRINVGYNKREDTYTGKLGYVIYWDDKGVLRKETSWQGWRDKSIEPTQFDNIPTEGFVLNKDVGGVRHSYGWDARLEKVRVYDPRGFEFEINIPNLLFILQECSSVKGKGLDGEFVYAWAGKELVLIPTSCAEYKTSVEFTSLQGKKIAKSDVVLGCSYTTKNNEKIIYIGRFDYTSYSEYNGTITSKKHIFYNEEINKYVTYDSFARLSVRNTDFCVDNFAELVENFTSGVNSSKIVRLTSKPMIVEESQLDYGKLLVKDPFEKISDTEFIEKRSYCSYSNETFRLSNYCKINFKDGVLYTKYIGGKYDDKGYTIDEINSLDFCQLYVVLESGKEIEFNKIFD